jgi:hypothetical protein
LGIFYRVEDAKASNAPKVVLADGGNSEKDGKGRWIGGWVWVLGPDTD